MADRDREMGVELGELSDELDEHDYPASSDDLVEEYGDYEIEYPNGSERFEEVIGPLNETYESADDVRQSIFNMVDSEAVGRQRYTDRGAGAAENPEEDPDQESF
ncbi:hypothetical protein ACFFQF_06515 [Haladaptatus pallidirubidus]|uniref:DUF2795 domain-containing protein n=1 Tax=Haladaptatus pallidirubidus TaxID=1008152 RepID=A0AAV3UM92_9EURY|nr:hypothetical protein [Haladaptatus pallidirubidus]